MNVCGRHNKKVLDFIYDPLYSMLADLIFSSVLDVSSFVSSKECTDLVLRTVCSMPDGSNADPPQEAAEPVTHTGGAFGKMYLRKGKMVHSTLHSQERRGKKV